MIQSIRSKFSLFSQDDKNAQTYDRRTRVFENKSQCRHFVEKFSKKIEMEFSTNRTILFGYKFAQLSSKALFAVSFLIASFSRDLHTWKIFRRMSLSREST